PICRGRRVRPGEHRGGDRGVPDPAVLRLPLPEPDRAARHRGHRGRVQRLRLPGDHVAVLVRAGRDGAAQARPARRVPVPHRGDDPLDVRPHRHRPRLRRDRHAQHGRPRAAAPRRLRQPRPDRRRDLRGRRARHQDGAVPAARLAARRLRRVAVGGVAVPGGDQHQGRDLPAAAPRVRRLRGGAGLRPDADHRGGAGAGLRRDARRVRRRLLPVRLQVPARVVEHRAGRVHRGRSRPRHRGRRHGRVPARRQPRDHQGRAVRGRGRRDAEGRLDAAPGDGGDRPDDAVDVRRDRPGGVRAGRRAAHGRVHQQVGARGGAHRGRAVGGPGGAAGQLAAVAGLRGARHRGGLVPPSRRARAGDHRARRTRARRTRVDRVRVDRACDRACDRRNRCGRYRDGEARAGPAGDGRADSAGHGGRDLGARPAVAGVRARARVADEPRRGGGGRAGGGRRMSVQAVGWLAPDNALVLPVTVAVPLLGGLAVLAFRRRPDLREAGSLVAGVATAALVLSLWPAASDGPTFRLWDWLPGIALVFALEPLGLLFATVAGVLWPVTTLYAIGYMRGNRERHQTRFYAFFALSITAALWIAFSGNLVTLFIGYEVLTLATWPLVAHAGDEKAKRAGRVYLALLLTTSIGLLFPALVWTAVLAGTTDFAPGG